MWWFTHLVEPGMNVVQRVFPFETSKATTAAFWTFDCHRPTPRNNFPSAWKASLIKTEKEVILGFRRSMDRFRHLGNRIADACGPRWTRAQSLCPLDWSGIVHSSYHDLFVKTCSVNDYLCIDLNNLCAVIAAFSGEIKNTCGVGVSPKMVSPIPTQPLPSANLRPSWTWTGLPAASPRSHSCL